MPELEEIYEFTQTALRSVGAEITSPWFYFQIGLILAAAGMAHLLAVAVRSRVDRPAVRRQVVGDQLDDVGIVFGHQRAPHRPQG